MLSNDSDSSYIDSTVLDAWFWHTSEPLTNDLAGPSAITENFSTVPNVGGIPDVTNDLLVGETTNGIRHSLPVAEAAPPAVAVPPSADTVFPNNSDDYIDHVEKKDKTLTLLKTYIKYRTRLNPPSKSHHCAYMKTCKSSSGKSFETMDEALVHVESHLKNVTKICRLCGQCFTKARYAKKHTEPGRCRPKRG
ncbi:hypothetical protein M422DRAFT_275855 [Sphaerobolus stellatus SS14]|uniref:Unplaced genomic scaffold SPHSTscaffold_566, whole genome shotgun sequence n=1 Tax=Sphaerobolus stellatus (strain SS14) TaxID=990650 RepID=A0A0C9T3V7_SPHS4|nr:hypothetical protein M422DRAFT_275855 [Sphaerobolus stellatus SS14]